MHTTLKIMIAASVTVLCGCSSSSAVSPSPSSEPTASSSPVVSAAPYVLPSASPATVSTSLVKSWSSQEIEDGSTHTLQTPVIADVTSTDNQITIAWNPVSGASKYDVSWGRADYLTSEPSFTFSTDESTWPNDMVGSDPIHIHIGALDDQDGYSAYTDVEIQAATGTITFSYYDYDNQDDKVGEANVDAVFPTGIQTFSVYDNTISVGPLQLGQAPDGWSFRGNFSFETKPIQPDTNNIVSIFVTKQ